MEITIENIDLLLRKKVPKHGKVSGIKRKRETVKVIVPNEKTKVSLIISDPSEVLERNVTSDGKILGLTNFVGKYIFVLDERKEDYLEKESGIMSSFESDEASKKEG